MAKPENYPWYELIEGGDELDQGDLLFGCSVIRVRDDAPYPLPLESPPIAIVHFDAIVMNQTCDFAQGKTETILVCVHESATDLDKGVKGEIIKGRRPRYAMLEESPFSECPMSQRVVDLSGIYQIPFKYAQTIASSRAPRLRLNPPYREHIAQAYGRFYMRIGFPQDIKVK